MQELQAELKAAKDKWGKEVELSKAEKGAPGFPFPVCLTRYTPRPESAAAWDVDELPVRLVVHSAEVESKPIDVEVPPYFPGDLSSLIEKAIDAEWKKMLKKKDKSQIWMLDKILTWVETNFVQMMSLNRAYIDQYEGCDDSGATMRRYVLVGPAAEEDEAPEEEDSEEEDEADLSPEEQQRRVEAYNAREEARIEAEFAEKAALAEEKRIMAEKGLNEDGEKARMLSKAEKAELNKSKKERSGQRWRKTGSKSHKPDNSEKDLSKMPGRGGGQKKK